MPNLIMVSDKKVSKDSNIFQFGCHVNQSFGRNQILSSNSEEDHGRIFSVKFHENWTGSFREEDV